MILFFESYSILQTLFLFNKIRKAETIYFHSDSVITPYSHRFKNYIKINKYKNIVRRLIRAINKDVNINTISQKITNEYNWESNKESLAIIDNLRSVIENSLPYKITLSIIGDKKIIKYYQHYLAQGYIANKIIFIKIAKDLKSSNDLVFVIPSENDFLAFVGNFINVSLDSFVPSISRKLNSVLDYSRKIKNGVIMVLFPILFIGRKIVNNGINLRKIHKRRNDILQKIAWGFNKKGLSPGNVLFKRDDGYLYNKSLGLKDIIFVFDRKNYSNKKESQKVMAEKNIPYKDIEDYKININIILASLKIQLQIFSNIFSFFSLIRGYNIFIYISYRAVYDLLKKLLELEYIETKVEFCRDDANATHIIRTIVSNRHGIKTVGVQHNVIPYIFPQLCYVHYDKYCIFSSAHLKLYSPYWQKLNLYKTGNLLIDNMINLSKNREKLNYIKSKSTSLYKKRKYTILISFPGPLPRNLSEKWDEVYNALCEFITLDIDASVFLRFRNVEHLNHPLVKRFAELSKRDGRIIIDHINFTTYEIMALCDLFISNSHSSGLIEAVAIGKKAFTFDFMGTAKYCFAKYGKDIILRTKEDVLGVFRGLENGFSGFNGDLDLLKKDYNYHYDGQCVKRIQDVVMTTIEESKEQR